MSCIFATKHAGRNYHKAQIKKQNSAVLLHQQFVQKQTMPLFTQRLALPHASHLTTATIMTLAVLGMTQIAAVEASLHHECFTYCMKDPVIRGRNDFLNRLCNCPQ